jgi:hypothetical protein
LTNAQHLGSLLANEARARMTGVVSTLEAENGSRVVVRRLAQPRTSQTVFNTVWAENKPNALTGSSQHPLCCDCEACLNGDWNG